MLLDINEGHPTVAVFVDMKKAFDTVCHTMFLEKIKHLGLHHKNVSWISNYLTDHHYQMTYATGVQSTLLPVTCGVPQGSILGPTFYLIYVNDIKVSLRNSKLRLYADDTVMYVSAPSPNHACTLLQRDLDKLSNWGEKNQLTVNTSKTKAMLFGMRHVHTPINPGIE